MASHSMSSVGTGSVHVTGAEALGGRPLFGSEPLAVVIGGQQSLSEIEKNCLPI